MPKHVHDSRTIVTSLRLEVRDLSRIDKFVRHIKRNLPPEDRDSVTRNSILCQVIREFLKDQGF